MQMNGTVLKTSCNTLRNNFLSGAPQKGSVRSFLPCILLQPMFNVAQRTLHWFGGRKPGGKLFRPRINQRCPNGDPEPMNTLFSRKSGLISATVALAFSPSNVIFADSCPPAELPLETGALTEIRFAGEHSRTLRSTVAMLGKHHYEEIQLDDDFSQLWLDSYIDFLDPAKSFLLQTDIDQINKKYSAKLDDYTKSGNLQPAEEIYLSFRNKAITQLERNLEILNDPDYEFNYASDKSLPRDREDYHWPANGAEAEEKSERLLTLSMLNLKLSGKEGSDPRVQLARRYRSQLSNLRQQKTQQVLDLYLNALGQIYDPHTDYFSPRQSENFKINMALSLEGIGAVLQKDDEFTKVVSVVPGGPAEQQGQLKAADRIVGVGEGEDCEFVDIIGWRLDEVVDRIRGPKGATIRLKVIPADEDNLSEERAIIRIVRDRVKLEENAVKSEVIKIDSQGTEYALGVIDIPSFYLDINAMRNRDPDYRSTTRDVRNILDDFGEQGIDGVIVDLRQNGGGSLLEAATLTDLFVDPGPVVQIRDQNNRIHRNHRARTKAHYHGPVMVLIDRLSASASEIFAGAIQDYGRGLIVGSQSFGKGTVQSVQTLPSGQLKLTESKFYRISGDSTQHKGVAPDIELPGLFNPLDIGESSYENALAWDQIRGIPHRRYEDYQTYLAPLLEKHSERLQSNADLQYLLGTIALAEERRAQKSVSLNEQVRITDRELWQEREKSLKKKWFEARGLPFDESEGELAEPLDLASESRNFQSGASVDLAGNELAPEERTDDAPKEKEPDVSEAILLETGRIFTDLLKITEGTNDSNLATFETGAG